MFSASPRDEAMLSLRAVLILTLKGLWRQRRTLVVNLVFPLGILIVLALLDWYVEVESWLPDMGIGFVQWMTYVYFIITCHRIALLGAGSVSPWGLFRWSMRETRFLLWAFLLYTLIGSLVVLSFSLLPNRLLSSLELPGVAYLMPFLAALPALYLLARLSLIFPALAVEDEIRVNGVWWLSRGNGWRLLVVVGILPITTSWLVSWLVPVDGTFIGVSLLTFLSMVVVILEVYALSVSYKLLAMDQAASEAM